jgi:hypothetical protein
MIFINIYLFPQEYFKNKNAEAMPAQRDLGSIRKNIHVQNLEM